MIYPRINICITGLAQACSVRPFLLQYIHQKFQGVLLFLDVDWCTKSFWVWLSSYLSFEYGLHMVRWAILNTRVEGRDLSVIREEKRGAKRWCFIWCLITLPIHQGREERRGEETWCFIWCLITRPIHHPTETGPMKSTSSVMLLGSS